MSTGRLFLLPEDAPAAAIHAAIGEIDGRVGVAGRDLRSGEELLYDADEPFPVTDTLAMLPELAGSGIDPSERIAVGADDRVEGGVLDALEPGLRPTLRDLATLAARFGDPTAIGVLERRLGAEAPRESTPRRLLTRLEGLSQLLPRLDGERLTRHSPAAQVRGARLGQAGEAAIIAADGAELALVVLTVEPWEPIGGADHPHRLAVARVGRLAYDFCRTGGEHIQRVPLSSTFLRSVGYDRRSGTLEVEMQNRSVYRFLDVPLDVHAALMSAASPGSYFNARIRDRYETRRAPA